MILSVPICSVICRRAGNREINEFDNDDYMEDD